MRENKIYSFIGLARKAGAVAMGEGLAEQAVKRGKAYLVLIADDAASNTAKKIRTAVYGRNVPLVGFGKKEQLGQILGKTFVSVIAVTDRSFAERIKELVELENNNDNSSYGGDFVEQTKNS
ncbi:MAG TPA: 50S ribosomal protein L7ae [Clostridiaceae bacterium]|nr:50S ribosomal protein L7ae [Clostridiaceae bacterium]